MKTRDFVLMINLILLSLLYYYAFTYLLKDLIPINIILVCINVVFISIYILYRFWKKEWLIYLLFLVLEIFLMGWIATLPLGIILCYGKEVYNFIVIMLSIYIFPMVVAISNLFLFDTKNISES